MSYIDDLLGAELPSKAKNSFDYMVKLLKDLRIPISMSKLTPPTTKIICLGIEVNSVEATLSIPPHKLTEILEECVEFKKRTCFTKRQLQSVIGKLMFVYHAGRETGQDICQQVATPITQYGGLCKHVN